MSNEGMNFKDNVNNILILDDEFEIMTLLKMALERQKYSVCGFIEPLTALEHFKINCTKYGLVISDIRMPAMNGFDFVKNIRQISSDVKVLLMSAFAVEEDPEFSAKLESNNVDDFIQKPFSMKKMHQVVTTHFSV